jgi:hypothetical protein
MKNQRLISHVAYLKKRKGLEKGVHISRHCRIIVYRPACTGIVHVIVKKILKPEKHICTGLEPQEMIILLSHFKQE